MAEPQVIPPSPPSPVGPQDRLAPPWTFLAGAAFSTAALLLLTARHRSLRR